MVRSHSGIVVQYKSGTVEINSATVEQRYRATLLMEQWGKEHEQCQQNNAKGTVGRWNDGMMKQQQNTQSPRSF